MTEPKRKAAIGFQPCGCPTYALVLGYESPAWEERDIADQIAKGLTVKIMTADRARKLPNFLNCPHTPRIPDDPRAAARRLIEKAGPQKALKV